MNDLALDPLLQFQEWFAEAQTAGVPAPEAMALGTSTPSGRPSIRMVLLKGADERGFTFFTNLESRKGTELRENPHAALLFHWQALGRQVRVEGPVAAVARDETGAYFQTRPLGSRIAAFASPQSRSVTDRAELERLVEATRERFPGDEVPLPEAWGGFRLQPDAYEFWEHGDDRLHDRVRYERSGAGWNVGRLAP